MLALTLLSCVVAVALAQYPYSPNNNAIHHGHHGGSSNNPAPVHYVSVGAQLQGDYKFGYNTGNGGSFREETRNPDGSVSGSYGYIDASGQQKVIKYTAGKDGFKAEGEDIPKAPPAPQPVAPQPNHHYQPQPQHHYQQPQHHYQQPQPQNHYQQPAPVPSYSNNYVHQAQPQYHGAPQQPAGYSPFAYNNGQAQHGQPLLSQLSYNIGAGNHNQYQG